MKTIYVYADTDEQADGLGQVGIRIDTDTGVQEITFTQPWSQQKWEIFGGILAWANPELWTEEMGALVGIDPLFSFEERPFDKAEVEAFNAGAQS